MVNSMVISAELARYLVKGDTEQRGYPLKESEVRSYCNKLRNAHKAGKYTLLNGDFIKYDGVWRLHTYVSYHASITAKVTRG